jgi:hypothetical protein
MKRKSTSGLIGDIVGGHLIGLDKVEEIVIDFRIFDDPAQIGMIEEIHSTLNYRYSKFGFIDKTGEIVIPIIYDACGYPSEGLVPVRLHDKWGFVDESGNEVIPFKYDSAKIFSGETAFRAQDGELVIVTG